jgi:biotin-dependent carboxylase-like uncharacterized protein
MMAKLRVLEPGLQSTLQDRGRHGYQRLGIPVSGALDWVSFETANLLVGNPAGTAAIEVSLVGPTLEVAADSIRVALSGTRGGIEILDAAPGAPNRLPAMQSIRLVRGTRFRIPGFGDTAVAYLAVEGGFAIEPVMGSLSTHWRAQTGPLEGRKLAKGDQLPLKLAAAPERTEVRLATMPGAAVPQRYRVVLGPQDDKFTPAQIEMFLTSTYRVSREADRWGLRLDGPALPHSISIVSDAIAPGSIQVPAGGLPLVLLADRATTGGYPKIATVISADLPAIGRLSPGAPVVFQAVTVEAAEAARRQLEAEVLQLRGNLEPVTDAIALDMGRLLSENLISGVVDGY